MNSDSQVVSNVTRHGQKPAGRRHQKYASDQTIEPPHFIICSDCFKNEGLRIEAERLGIKSDRPCSHCGSTEGAKFSTGTLETLLRNFFVAGSVPPNVGGFAPLYEVFSRWPKALLGDSDRKLIDFVYRLTYSVPPPPPAWLGSGLTRIKKRAPKSVSFAGTLGLDYDLIRRRCSYVVSAYRPDPWERGQTEHYEKLEKGGPAAQNAIQDLLQRAKREVLPAGTKLYRVRTNIDQDVQDPRSFDAPPSRIRRGPRRFDDYDFPVLYASTAAEVCLHECRVTLADEITLATLKTIRDLTILNLADSFDDASDQRRSVRILMNKLCGTDETNYLKCRLISRAVHRAGFAGFRFRSYFFDVGVSDSFFNIALFGHPIHDGSSSSTSSINFVLVQL